MLRKTTIVFAMTVALTGGLTADAFARGGGGGGHGSGHMGGGFDGGHMVGSGEAHFAGGLHHRSWFREANTTTAGSR